MGDSIRIDLRETGWEIVDWIQSGSDPLVASREHGNELSGAIKAGEIPD
jgi:hypothetical protein